MSTIAPELIRNCKRCAHELAPGALACEKCHALVHSEELERLAADANALEATGDIQQARERWLLGLRLLPPSSKQAHWIRERARALEAAGPQHASARASAVALGSHPSLLPRVTLGLAFLLSFAAFVWVYWKASGAQFGVGFAALILIHEMGHYVDIRRRGLPADMPVFLPGLGAYVRWRAMGVSLETRAAISLAGPLAGFLAAAVCAALWWRTSNIFWAELARVGAALNLLNLVPVWILDGGQAALALGKAERISLLIACVVLWLVLRENLFLLVAAGTAYRAFFSADLPVHPSRATTVYFVAVLTALGVVLSLLPGHGLGLN